ncbi:MAG: DUF922 domain-containing protein [Flavobacteriales bacterium]|nr:DUF922 domain-containing protein [Flavobacteriales bacterium]
MKSLLLILLMLFPFFASENDKMKMRWSETKKLTWNDFKGTPSGSNDYVASTNSGISFSYSYRTRNGETKFDYTVQSNFYPELSWYRPTLVSDYILQHEQTHFDISELFARMLRKQLAQLDAAAADKETVDALYQQIELARREMQYQYDRESEHSKNKEVELQWRAYIANELQAYARWK